jgi:Protein of unknown function (DUF3828)
MRKILVSSLVVFAMIVSVAFSWGANERQQNTPEATVKTFYTWFLNRDAENHGYPLMDNTVLRYVAKDTVGLLRTRYKQNYFAERAEYFTNVQDFDEKDWLAHMSVRPALMLGDVALVAITLGSTETKTNVAFLRNFDGIWKITKVVDTRDYE